MSTEGTQTAPQATTPGQAPAAPGPATLTLTQTQLEAMINGAVARAVSASQPVSDAAPAPANPPSKTNLFAKGTLVAHRFWDSYDERTVTRYGVVVEVLAAEGENGFARSRVAWFSSASGPIGDHELEEV